MMLTVATVSVVANEPVLSELGRWDGAWYARLATSGYPSHLVSGPSTLGFFPLLPLAMRGRSHGDAAALRGRRRRDHLARSEGSSRRC